MEVTITHTEQRPLLKRTELQARIFFTGATPKRTEIASAIAKKGGYKKELLIVEHIYTAYGETAATVQCHLYDDKKSLERLERANLREKHAAPPQPETTAQEEPAPAKEPASEESSGDADTTSGE